MAKKAKARVRPRRRPETVADSIRSRAGRELARNVRNERRILELSRRLRRLLARRDSELLALRDTIYVFRGEPPPPYAERTPQDDSLEAAHG